MERRRLGDPPPRRRRDRGPRGQPGDVRPGVTTDGIRVAGLDGCPAGWLLVTATPARSPHDRRRPPAALGAVGIEVVATFAATLAPVLDRLDRGDGGRHADRSARRRAPPGRSGRSSTAGTPTIVGVPDAGPGRAGRGDYLDALARSRAVDGRGPVDAVLPPPAPHGGGRRGHDAGAAGAGVRVPSRDRRSPGSPAVALPVNKHSSDGLARRRDLLDPWLVDGIDSIGPAPRGAEADDVLDAIAVGRHRLAVHGRRRGAPRRRGSRRPRPADGDRGLDRRPAARSGLGTDPDRWTRLGMHPGSGRDRLGDPRQDRIPRSTWESPCSD